MKRLYTLFVIVFAAFCIGAFAVDGVDDPTAVDGVTSPASVDGVVASACTEEQSLGASDDTTQTLGSSNEYDIAGSFTTPGTGYDLTKVSVKFAANTGSPTGNIHLEIRDDNSTEPGTQTGSDSSTVAASSISAGYVDFTFSAITLSLSTRYWVTVEDGTTNASNYENVRYDGTGGEHVQKRTGGGWTNVDNSAEMTFITYSGDGC